MGMEFKLKVDQDKNDTNPVRRINTAQTSNQIQEVNEINEENQVQEGNQEQEASHINNYSQVNIANQNEIQAPTSVLLPEADEKDQEIQFIDPEQIKKAQAQEREKNENDPDAKKAPVIIGQNLSKSKRSKYIQDLVMKSRKTCTLDEIKSMNRQTCLVSKKQEAQNIAEVDQEELKRQLIEQADDYINQEDQEEDEEEQIDYKRIIELEGDGEGEGQNDEEVFDDEAEAEGEGDNKEDPNKENADNIRDQNNDEQADLKSLSNHSNDQIDPKEKYDPVKQAENLRYLKAKIKQRKLAVKFFENEAELGSDHEENDEGQKNINTNDYEEILDRKLELLDDDLKDLIDNESVDSDSDLGAKLLQDHIEDDKKHTANIIKAMAMKSRYRADRDRPDIEEGGEHMWNRMRQKQFDVEGEEAEEEVKERIRNMCDQEGLDDDEKERIVEEEMRRKIRRTMKMVRMR